MNGVINNERIIINDYVSMLSHLDEILCNKDSAMDKGEISM